MPILLQAPSPSANSSTGPRPPMLGPGRPPKKGFETSGIRGSWLYILLYRYVKTAFNTLNLYAML